MAQAMKTASQTPKVAFQEAFRARRLPQGLLREPVSILGPIDSLIQGAVGHRHRSSGPGARDRDRTCPKAFRRRL